MARPDLHREPLLRAAAQLLRRRGYAAMSTGDVLAAAGATNGSLYHHFPGGKQELARAALEASGARVEAGLRAALADAPDPATAVAGWVGALIAALEADGRDGCPVAPTAAEATTLGDELRATAVGQFARWTTVLEGALEPTHGADAGATARVLLSAIEGALLLDRVAGTTTHLRAVRAAVPSLVKGV